MKVSFLPLRSRPNSSWTVSMSAIICVGWNSVVRPFQTGTPAFSAKVSTMDCVKSAVLDAVIHAAEDARGILDGFFLAHLRALGVEVGHAHAEVHGPDLERAAGARGGLLEEKDDVLALEVAVRLPGALLRLEVGGEVNEILDLLGGEVEELEEVAARDIDCHGVSLCIVCA